MPQVPLPVHDTPKAFQDACEKARRDGHSVGFVPTMGALHAGHLALVAEARRRCSFVAVSIFVNPTQFGPGEDLSRYPRTFERDLDGCARAGAACVFAPDATSMYPPDECTRVRVDRLTDSLCGPVRPGHFEGVATIVAKLFALAGPCVAVFGRKDFQQLRVIERMARDLFFPVEVVGLPTVREPDGLAMSSRNAYLSADDRRQAAQIPLALSQAVRAFQAGERSVARLARPVRERLARISSSIDYVQVADPLTLVPWADDESAGERALLAIAARVGPARLIDNVVLGEDPAPCLEEEA